MSGDKPTRGGLGRFLAPTFAAGMSAFGVRQTSRGLDVR